MTVEEFSIVRKTLPNNPGVYRYYDKDGLLLYVGKAKNIKKRVSSYFTGQEKKGAKLNLLVRQIQQIDTSIVNTERDALLLENNLIKKHQPKYNVMLKDDKTYPYIVLKKEEFPRIFFTRRLIRDGSEYFGPYINVHRSRAILDFIKKLYPIRTCNLKLSAENIAAEKFKVCLEYHIKNCLGPCVSHQKKEDYDSNIEQIRSILKGDLVSVRKAMKQRMDEHAQSLEFEQAQDFKLKISSIDVFKSKSQIVNPKLHDIDAMSIVSDDKYAFANFIKVSNGSIVQIQNVELRKRLDETDEELLIMALYEIQSRGIVLGKEILLPFSISIPEENRTLTIPLIGDKKKLLDLSSKNAFVKLKEKQAQNRALSAKRKSYPVLDRMQEDLRLKDSPIHIECFDNSNFQGSQPVASMVIFRNGKPFKSEYRRYNIKTVVGPDDFASMEEVVYRRYKRLLEEDSSLPQLIVIDGGKGQLNAAVKSLKLLGIDNQLTVIGIAKRLEEIYFPGDSLAIHLDKRSPTLKLIQRLRNEAHRFAIEFHRKKRAKATIKTELTEIPGIGEKTAQKLLSAFRSVKGIKKANLDAIEEVVGKSAAKKVKAHLR